MYQYQWISEENSRIFLEKDISCQERSFFSEIVKTPKIPSLPESLTPPHNYLDSKRAQEILA